MNTISFTINNDVITVFDQDYMPVSIDSTHPNHRVVLNKLTNTLVGAVNLDQLIELMKPVEAVKKAISGTGITIDGDRLLRNGVELHGLIIDRILYHHSAGDTIEHLVRFLDKLYENPSHRVVQQLYGFLEASNVAITREGNFVAYKIVSDNFKDLFTHSIDNSVGAIVSVPRNQVDEDPDQTCSNGLHVCGFAYLSSYGSVRSGRDRVVSVVVDPRNVVAVPRDYNNNKMRVCEYTVLSDITDKVRDKVGLSVGLDHDLSYTSVDNIWDTWEDDVSLDDDWADDDIWGDGFDDDDVEDYEDPWLNDDDDYITRGDDYYDGLWVDHVSEGRPVFVYGTDRIEVELNSGDITTSSRKAEDFSWHYGTPYAIKKFRQVSF